MASVTGSALGAGLTADAIASAESSKKTLSPGKPTPAGVKLQVLLDRAHFSPGEIDGKFGKNARKALRTYAEARRLPSSDAPTADVWNALHADDRPVTMSYTIDEKDVAGPFLSNLPDRMEDMKIFRSSATSVHAKRWLRSFTSARICCRCSTPINCAGDSILVVDTGAKDEGSAKADRVEVDKKRPAVSLFDKSNSLIAFYPAPWEARRSRLPAERSR